MRSLISGQVTSELIECVYAAGCDPQQWEHFVGGVQAALPGTAFSIQIALNQTVLQVYRSTAGIPDDYIKSYLEYYQYISPYIALFERFTLDKVYKLSGLLPMAEVKSHVFYHEWLKPVGDLTYAAGATLFRDSDRLLCMSIDIPDRMGHVEEGVAGVLRKLAPHMKRAFQLNERLRAMTLTHQALDGMIEQLQGAAFLMTKEGRVLTLNREAEDLVRKAALVRITPTQRLIFTNGAHDQAYRAALASVLNPGNDRAATSFAIDCGQPERKAVTVLPLRPSGDPGLLAATSLALVIIHGAQTLATPAQVLRSLYGLTKAEAEVVLRVANGLSPSEIAVALKVSKVTVRNQLAAAMGKLGVRSQAQVAALVASHSPRLRFD
jgi:DNA-binding CsgD family transcriptional regulator